MKRKIKFGCALVIVVTVIIAIIFGLHWAWKYYLLPEWVDSKEYKTIEERAERAIVFIKKHNMNENYMLFVDYSIPSGTPRLFVWDFQRKKIVEVNTPSHEQCVAAHLERNASRLFLHNLRKYGEFMPDKEIREIDYLDPFNNKDKWQQENL